MVAFTVSVKRWQVKSLAISETMCLWSVKEAGTKFDKGICAKSSLVKWSQDWSLDPKDQVVQEVEWGGEEVANIWSCCSK